MASIWVEDRGGRGGGGTVLEGVAAVDGGFV